MTVSTGMLIMVNTFAPFDVNQSEQLKMLAVRVHNRLCLRGESQNVLFLGESGSGKSEFRGNVLGHFLGKSLALSPKKMTYLLTSTFKQPIVGEDSIS